MTDPQFNPFLVWVDIETGGLNPYSDPILEIGFAVTDLELNIQDTASWYFGKYINSPEDISKDRHVRDMHTKSGLADKLYVNNDSTTDEETVTELTTWLTHTVAGWGGFDPTAPILKGALGPMCGSSVHFDREFLSQDLPDVVDLFTYRNIDVSTIKELCNRWNPTVAAKRDEVTLPKKLHRAEDDLIDTIGEAKFYRDNFLFVTE